VLFDKPLPHFTGTPDVRNGHLELVSANLSAISLIGVRGAFQSNDKYPIGGYFQLEDAGYPDGDLRSPIGGIYIIRP